MSIRPLNNKKTKWEIDYYPQGRKGVRKRTVIYGSETDARQAELEFRRDGKGIIRSINPKIMDVIPEYLEWLKLHRAENTYNDVKRSLNFLLPHFGRLQAPRIIPTVINKYKQFRAEHPCAVNKELAYLRGILTFMVNRNYATPLSFKIGKMPYQKPLPQIPHPDDFAKFFAEIKDNAKKAMILLMWDNGFRWKEVSRLKWEEIDWTRNIIYLTDTKGNYPRLGILTDEVRLLLELQRKGKGFVFINPKTAKPYKGLYTLFKAACRRSGVRRIRPHLLRHAFGTYSLEATGDLRLVQTMMGHKDINTTIIYTQITTNRIRDGMKKLSDYRSRDNDRVIQ